MKRPTPVFDAMQAKGADEMDHTGFWLVQAPLSRVRAFQEAGRLTLRAVGRRKAFLSRVGDRVAFYSSAESELGGLCQSFTAVAALGEGFNEVRSRVHGIHYEAAATFLSVARPVRVVQLLQQLQFIEDRVRWSRSFPRTMGVLSPADFQRICRAMRVELS